MAIFCDHLAEAAWGLAELYHSRSQAARVKKVCFFPQQVEAAAAAPPFSVS